MTGHFEPRHPSYVASFLALALHQRDEIKKALRDDETDLELKAAAERLRGKGGAYPVGRVGELLHQWGEEGSFPALFREAVAELSEHGLEVFLDRLEALRAAHEAFLEAHQRRLETKIGGWVSGDPPSLPAIVWDDHCLACNAVLETVLPALDGKITWGREATSSGVTGKGVKNLQASKIALAIAVLSQHPDWTVKKVAEEVGCHAKYLSGSAQFKTARKAIQAAGAAEMRRLPRDRKGKETWENFHPDSDGEE